MNFITELRKFKILNMAIFDFIATFVCVFIIHYYMWTHPIYMKDPTKRTYVQYFTSLIFLFVTFIGIGVIMHYIFNIQSGLSAYLGFNDMYNKNKNVL